MNNLSGTPEMTIRANPLRPRIVGRGAGSVVLAALPGWALVVVSIGFDGVKLTARETNGITLYIAGSPILCWLRTVFGVREGTLGYGWAGAVDRSGPDCGSLPAHSPRRGTAMPVATGPVASASLLSAPGVAKATTGGFPAIPAAPGRFLLEDLVPLAASPSLLMAPVQGRWLTGRKS